jgi:hypothetical protein
VRWFIEDIDHERDDALGRYDDTCGSWSHPELERGGGDFTDLFDICDNLPDLQLTVPHEVLSGTTEDEERNRRVEFDVTFSIEPVEFIDVLCLLTRDAHRRASEEYRQRIEVEDNAVLAALDKLDPARQHGVPLNKALLLTTGLSPDRFNEAIRRLKGSRVRFVQREGATDRLIRLPEPTRKGT